MRVVGRHEIGGQLIVDRLTRSSELKVNKDVERNQKRLSFNGKWKSCNCELKAVDKCDYWCTSDVIDGVFLPYNMLSF